MLRRNGFKQAMAISRYFIARTWSVLMLGGSVCRIYRVAPKNGTVLWYALTSSSINRLSKLFHCQNQEKICNNVCNVHCGNNNEPVIRTVNGRSQGTGACPYSRGLREFLKRKNGFVGIHYPKAFDEKLTVCFNCLRGRTHSIA